MRWVKLTSIVCIVLCLFAGGIAFDIFIVQKFTYKNTLESRQDNQIEILQSIEISRDIKPDLLQTNIGIVGGRTLENSSLTDSNRELITKKLDSIAAIVKANKDICKYIPYYQPVIHDNNNEKRIGNTYLNIECNIHETNNKQYEDLISQIKNIVDQDEWLDFNFNSFMFALSDSAQTSQEAMLREQIIKKANDIGNEYSKNLNAKCNIAQMLFNKDLMYSMKNDFEDKKAIDFKTDMKNFLEYIFVPLKLGASIKFLCKVN